MNRISLNDLSLQIAISIDDLRFILQQIEFYIPATTVWAFGSRTKGSHRPASDLDLAILCDRETSKNFLPKLNEIFTESDLPYKVQLLDYNRLPENMQENIIQNYVTLYSAENK